MTDQRTLEIDLPDIIKRLLDLVLPRADDIMGSPAKLGELLSICVEFAEIEPIVRERASTLALQKKEVLGWILVHRDGHRYVEAQQLIQLALHCPASRLTNLLATFAMTLGNVSQAKYELLCEAAELPADPEAIKQSGATVFLRRSPSGENQQIER